MLEQTVADLQKCNRSLEAKIKALEKENQNGAKACQQLESILSKYTPGIRKMLLDPSKTFAHWSLEDCMFALKLYNISPKAYIYVRQNLLPLPGISKLKAHLAKMELQPDKPIQSVFSLLNSNFIDEPYGSQPTLCVLALDEMSVDNRYVYDPSLDQVMGAMKNVTLFCARGLSASWKQPLMYSFNGNTAHVLDLIKLLYENGLKVVGVISDMGPKNLKMWKELGIGKVQRGVLNTTHFAHPLHPKDNVYWFTDFPHLLKRLRDHLLDSSILLPGGTVLNRSWIQNLILKQKDELKLTFKLGLKNLYLRNQERQNCSTAYQLFSHTVATAIRVIMTDREGYNEVADFFDLMNDLSDLFNTRMACDDPNKFKTAYGIYLEEQDELLEKAKETLMNCRIGVRCSKTYAPFQKGFLVLFKSTQELFQELRSAVPGMKYIMLSRFNQDFLESVFSLIRGFGGFNANPNCVQFKYRLRKLVLMWNLSNKAELSVDFDILLREIKSNFVQEVFSEIPCPQQVCSPEKEQELLFVDPNVDAVKDFDVENMKDDDIVSDGAQEYIAGYLAAKLRYSNPELSADLMDVEKRNLWVARLSKGGLIEPSKIWFAYFQKFEEYFRAVNSSSSVDMEPGVVQKLTNALLERFPEVPVKVIKFYSRCRMFIRIKYLNKLIQDEKYTREHQRYLALQAESEEDFDENRDDVEELSSTGKEILIEFLQ